MKAIGRHSHLGSGDGSHVGRSGVSLVGGLGRLRSGGEWEGGNGWVSLEMSPQDCRSVVDFREAHWWAVRGPGCSRSRRAASNFGVG